MLKASALYIVLIISVLLASMCLSVILLSYYYRKEMVAYDIEQKLITNVSSGINILLAENSDSGNEKIIDLFGEATDTVILSSSQWGVFEIGKVKAFSGNKTACRTFFFGYKPAEETESCLYAADNNRPISLAGKTRLKGKCYLPESGLQRGYIGSRSFEGTNLHEGKILKSGYQLYPVRNQVAENLKSLIKGKYNNPIKSVAFSSLKDKILQVSFSDTSVELSGKGPVLLNGNFKGNIIIRSDQLIHVTSDAHLRDVILIAPRIYIDDNFEGIIQAFASDTIIAGNKVKLNYPTVLGLVQNDSAHTGGLLQLKDDCRIKGQIFSLRNQTSMIQPRITISKGSVVEGQVYSSGYLQVYGSIYGHTAASTLSVYTGGFTYDNFLIDAVFDYSELNNHFVSSALLPTESKKLLIKWVE